MIENQRVLQDKCLSYNYTNELTVSRLQQKIDKLTSNGVTLKESLIKIKQKYESHVQSSKEEKLDYEKQITLSITEIESNLVFVI